VRDNYNKMTGKYTTTKFIDNKFNKNTFKLQNKLNKNGYTDRFGEMLKLDGLFGAKTQWASDMSKGMVPNLSYINPLQTELTRISIRKPRKDVYKKTDSKKFPKCQLTYDGKGNPLFELDYHGINTKEGKISTPHINVGTNKNPSPLQKSMAKKLNHQPIPYSAYEAFHNFDDVAKMAKKGGKAMSAVGVALDMYEIGGAVYMDLNDDDKKLGKKSLETSVGVGGGWAGGAAGAKLGTMGGSAAGSFFCPGLGTAIGGFVGGIAGGIVGAFGGRELSEYIVDKAYEWE
ncbi:MAG: hypothetical protein RSA27_07755, partial [Oscillospiraceae bacterium]